jgi:AraC-like DNA-binding protein
MPIYMDRHDLPESVNAEHVAQIHQEDLKIEHEYGCKGLTYWFDDQRKTAFCLIKAPNKKALQDMHDHAHGGVANSIIEVDPSIVESFLGRIEDPVKAKNTKLNIINDPAFRVLMVMNTTCDNPVKSNLPEFKRLLNSIKTRFISLVKAAEGRIVKENLYESLISFKSISGALKCALEIQSAFEKHFDSGAYPICLRIGMSTGVPVSKGEGIFEETIKIADRLCKIVGGSIAVSYEVKELYESENHHKILDTGRVRVLQPADERFLTSLMDFVEQNWNRTNLRVDDFSADLGFSKAQLYRKVKFLTGESLNIFIRAYRLERARKMMDCNTGNISEIAFDTGFNSAAYFSKCFLEAYGMLPSEYFKQYRPLQV